MRLIRTQSTIRLGLIILLLALAGAQAWCVIDSLGNDVPLGDRLFVAVSSGDANEVRSLLRRGASPLARDSAGMTPLMCAAECGRDEIAQMLIGSGSPLDVSDRYGMTPLLHAVRGGHVGMVAMLLGSSAADDRIESERSALECANAWGSDAVAAFLRTQLNIVPASFTAPRGTYARPAAQSTLLGS
jgi:hypothetical protein